MYLYLRFETDVTEGVPRYCLKTFRTVSLETVSEIFISFTQNGWGGKGGCAWGS